ncbi:MAG: RHS repeat-associated core domain-containing protein [Phycisphaerales bacterium]|nr:RHS repeat-associated core domain-containing protein [Phycisphaerales bacterium]
MSPFRSSDWDAENRLVTVRPIEGTEAAGMSRVDFGYDSAWRRVRKTVTPWDANTSNWASAPSLDRKYLWSGWRLLLETDVLASGGEAVLRSFTWGLDLAGLNGAVNSLEQAGTIGGLLAVREYDVSGGPSPADPVAYVYLYDANGNVGQVVDWSHTASDPAGAIVAHYEYDPYGGVTKAAGSYAAENAWRFSTKQWDDEAGLGYWGYRYYSPSLGRWMSRDPIEEEGGYGLYLYTHNAMPSKVDPLGLCEGRYEVSWWVCVRLDFSDPRTSTRPPDYYLRHPFKLPPRYFVWVT